jgi:hypothetical protein
MVEMPVIMAESKLKDHEAAEEELHQYTMEFLCKLCPGCSSSPLRPMTMDWRWRCCVRYR